MSDGGELFDGGDGSGSGTPALQSADPSAPNSFRFDHTVRQTTNNRKDARRKQQKGAWRREGKSEEEKSLCAPLIAAACEPSLPFVSLCRRMMP